MAAEQLHKDGQFKKHRQTSMIEGDNDVKRILFDTDEMPELDVATLRGHAMDGAKLHRAIFDKEDMREIRLRGADLRGANLFEVDLTDADLQTASSITAFVTSARLHRANLAKCRARHCHFDGSDLRDANLDGADISGANFDKADLRGRNSRLRNSPEPHLLEPCMMNRRRGPPGLIPSRPALANRQRPGIAEDCNRVADLRNHV